VSRGDRPTSRRDFLREGLRSLVRAGFGGIFERLEHVSELIEGREPKPLPLQPVLSCETRSLHALMSTGQLPLESLPPLLHELDIRGVSVSDRHLPALQPRLLEPLRETLTRNGLVITGLMVATPLRLADYKGAISIEYMGEEDPVEGIRKTRDLIRRYWRAY
jgi:hypothetical protein